MERGEAEFKTISKSSMSWSNILHSFKLGLPLPLAIYRTPELAELGLAKCSALRGRFKCKRETQGGTPKRRGRNFWKISG